VEVEVRHNDALRRYELWVDGTRAGEADYDDSGSNLVFLHTEVLPSLRGKGLGRLLVRAALDDVRSTGRSVVPRCSFVARFIGDNPAYADLVAA
jgi:uncharacterized protein